MLLAGLLAKMLRVPPPAYPISITSALAATSSATGLKRSASSTLFQWLRSRNRNGASMNGAAFENVDMCAGETMA